MEIKTRYIELGRNVFGSSVVGDMLKLVSATEDFISKRDGVSFTLRNVVGATPKACLFRASTRIREEYTPQSLSSDEVVIERTGELYDIERAEERGYSSVMKDVYPGFVGVFDHVGCLHFVTVPDGLPGYVTPWVSWYSKRLTIDKKEHSGLTGKLFTADLALHSFYNCNHDLFDRQCSIENVTFFELPSGNVST